MSVLCTHLERMTGVKQAAAFICPVQLFVLEKKIYVLPSQAPVLEMVAFIHMNQ